MATLNARGCVLGILHTIVNPARDPASAATSDGKDIVAGVAQPPVNGVRRLRRVSRHPDDGDALAGEERGDGSGHRGHAVHRSLRHRPPWPAPGRTAEYEGERPGADRTPADR
jgi:hypothetical protein